MRIITIGREFGSGGRELGKRLADALGVPCYDKEVINEVANLHNISPEYVERITEADISVVYAATIGHTFTAPIFYNNSAIQVIASHQEVVKKLAMQGDCVFVGRCADVILKDFNPLNIFVYADKESKLKRCAERAAEGETEKDILKHMQRIDRDRIANRRITTDTEWGKKETYHLCINTSGIEVKQLVPCLAQYARVWFDARNTK